MTLNGQKIQNIQIDGINRRDYPDFVDAYISYAEFQNGEPLTAEQLNDLNDESGEIINEMIHEGALYV